MYAIVKIGSYQYKVSEGDMIEADRIEGKKGKSIKLDKVLLFATGKDVRIGQPYLKDVSVTAKAIDDVLGEKKIAFRYKVRKHSSRRKVGHRQKYTLLNIEKIEAK